MTKLENSHLQLKHAWFIEGLATTW